MEDMMSEKILIHIIRKSDFVIGNYPLSWIDPHHLTEVGTRFHRLLITNPLSKAEDEPTQIIALIGTQVVGRLNVFMGQLTIDGRPLPILWCSGLRVSPDFRCQGVATRLVET